MRFFIYVLLTLYLIPIKSFSYEEINCTSIQNEIDIKHTYYVPDTCYKFTAQNVKCPTDKNKIRSYNVQ